MKKIVIFSHKKPQILDKDHIYHLKSKKNHYENEIDSENKFNIKVKSSKERLNQDN